MMPLTSRLPPMMPAVLTHTAPRYRSHRRHRWAHTPGYRTAPGNALARVPASAHHRSGTGRCACLRQTADTGTDAHASAGVDRGRPRIAAGEIGVVVVGHT